MAEIYKNSIQEVENKVQKKSSRKVEGKDKMEKRREKDKNIRESIRTPVSECSIKRDRKNGGKEIIKEKYMKSSPN